jgi:hypothetical protein
MPQRILSCLLLTLLFASVEPARGQDSLREADVKAAMLYNFTKFIEWPAGAFKSDDAPLVVGIYGEEHFVNDIAKLLEGKKAHGHSIQVRRLTTNEEAAGCQILFVREAEMKRFQPIGEVIKRKPILTVGESDEFLDAGGMFNITLEDKLPRFEVNPAAAESAGLTISSKVLRLAKKVKKGGAK